MSAFLNQAFPEPTLTELLSDPVTRAVMQADGVNPWELEEMLRGLAHLRAQSSDDTNLPPATSAPLGSRRMSQPLAQSRRATMTNQFPVL
jgi:hypothetical protein